MATRARLPWDRLQSLLEGLHPGDELELGQTAKQTGLDVTSCETVLEALASIDLFTRAGNQTYIRRRMLEPLERRQNLAGLRLRPDKRNVSPGAPSLGARS